MGYHYMETIPRELTVEIAAVSPVIWGRLSIALPSFGRYSSTLEGRRKFAELFMRLRWVGLCYQVEFSADDSLVDDQSVHKDDQSVHKDDQSVHRDDQLNHRDNQSIRKPHIIYNESIYDWPGHIYAAKDVDCEAIRGMWFDGSPEDILKIDGVDKIAWLSRGLRHRMADPAVIYSDGTKLWYHNGMYHRDGDNPSAIWANGRIEYHKHGKRHRGGDRPALISGEVTAYYKRGNLHRRTGPAYICGSVAIHYVNGSRFYLPQGH